MSTISNKEDVLKPKSIPSSLKNSKLFLTINGLLIALVAFQIGGSIGSHSSTNETLKLCNENILECKFKYDILMYQQTGVNPYKNQPKEKVKTNSK